MYKLGILLSIMALCGVNGNNGESYGSMCDNVKGKIIDRCIKEITTLSETLDSSTPLQSFGSTADDICNGALEEFAASAPPSTSDTSKSAVYDRKLEELEVTLDAPLKVLYLRQLGLLRERAMAKYKQGRGGEKNEYEAMVEADDLFTREAEEATRQGGGWDYSSERTSLQSVLNDLASNSKKVTAVELRAAQQQSTAMQYLQMQQQQIQQMQMQLYGQSSPWNVGFAYRVPDTNINLQGSHQQGRTNLQMSCVPDEYANMLGPNGFTNGVGPGNLGLSVNLNL